MHILFYDMTTPLSYTDTTLKAQALRGTEATIIRIAHALKNYYQVTVAQHCRTEDCYSDSVNYVSFASAHRLKPDIVILLRQHRALATVVAQFPKAKIYFWLHNLPTKELYDKKAFMCQHQIEIIAVSNFHRSTIEKRLKGKWYQRLFSLSAADVPVHVVYNPVDDELIPDATPRKTGQLIFSSSIYKGFELVLKMFTRVQSEIPDYELIVVSPEPLNNRFKLPKNVRFIGPLPQHKLAQHLRTSELVFYPQWQRVETFGLVYAEANAVGTPVLAHDFGAASEVLNNPDQLIDGKNIEAILTKLKQWRTQPPVISMKPEFRLGNVTKAWINLLS